ncbi:metal ABC transporter solute-binding protein, Zn/Mn family [Clostridium sp.]|uniref:metal ABC transporter solute-binding protein, Zn/Mn family n=1 Tax=Clostridium sp. TaxID=1506 RepID=UPI003FA5DE79
MQERCEFLKKFIGIIGALIMSFALIGCSQSGDNKAKDNGKLQVTASIYPLEQLTKMIGGDKVDVLTLVKPGQEPHDFDFKPADFEKLTKSDIFVYNGLGLETWLDNAMSQLKDNDIYMVEASKGVNVIKDGDKVDPHVWLSLKDATIEAENIKNALIAKDPSNKDYYEENYKKLKSEFEGLYNEYKPKFDKLKRKDFITGHAAFGYLCKEFGLEQKSIKDIYGDGEATPKKLEELTKYCKDNNIKTIFSESLAEPKTSETLARESGAKVEKIYSLESSEDDKTYLDGMRYNLDVIYKSLEQENK